MAANVAGVLSEEDVRAAQDALDTWAHLRVIDVEKPHAVDASDLLELRGLLAARMADVRTAGYLEGVQRGRREAAHVVLDALRDEGLAP